jgi:UMF1 family MFS transporter
LRSNLISINDKVKWAETYMKDTGEDRKAVIGWALYDWANSAFATTVIAGFFPVFFNQYWSAGTDTNITTARLGAANSAAGVVVALLAPVLGSIADRGSYKKRFLSLFTFLGVAMTCGLYLVSEGQWQLAIVTYVIASVGFSGGNIFYDALLTGIASEKRLDRVSSLGYALGYLGGGLLFAFNVWMTLKPHMFGFSGPAEAVRFSFLTTGIWWAIFSVPVFLFVGEPETDKSMPGFSAVRAGMLQLRNTFREFRHLRTIFLFLAAYWLYIDGVDTIIRMAVDYGISIGLESSDLITALLITQFVGFPSAIAFGRIGTHIGAKRAVFIAIAVYLGVSVWGAFISGKYEFYILAVVVGLVQGGIQALSRSLYARIIPAGKSAEYFGFYNMLGKFAAVLGPVAMGATGLMVRRLGYGSDIATRAGIASVAFFFIAGGLLLYFVDEQKGREEAEFLERMEQE